MNKKQINKEEILKLYNDGLSMIKIAEHFGYKSYGPIRTVLFNEGIDLKLRIGSNSRLKNIDETFFDVIDTPDKAYILGWIISDGYVNKYKLTFCIKDLEILEKIKSIMKSDHKITNSTYYDKRTDKHYQRYFLQITSKKIVNSLNNLGIYQSKSFTVDLPNIPEHLYQHLIRGIFDGDGYIGVGVRKTGSLIARFSMIVSEKLYNKLEPIFNNLGITFMEPSIVAEKNNEKVLKIRVYRNSELLKFFNYIYGDGNVTKLERKYDKFKLLFI
jgi:hypothetical protein